MTPSEVLFSSVYHGRERALRYALQLNDITSGFNTRAVDEVLQDADRFHTFLTASSDYSNRELALQFSLGFNETTLDHIDAGRVLEDARKILAFLTEGN